MIKAILRGAAATILAPIVVLYLWETTKEQPSANNIDLSTRSSAINLSPLWPVVEAKLPQNEYVKNQELRRIFTETGLAIQYRILNRSQSEIIEVSIIAKKFDLVYIDNSTDFEKPGGEIDRKIKIEPEKFLDVMAISRGSLSEYGQGFNSTGNLVISVGNRIIKPKQAVSIDLDESITDFYWRKLPSTSRVIFIFGFISFALLLSILITSAWQAISAALRNEQKLDQKNPDSVS